MSQEIILETNSKRYAPDIHAEATSLVDEILMEELKAIPDKLAFKIGDVAEIAKLKSYVLRYWETEFDALKPKKSKHNQRVYTRKDVEIVLMIKKLLYKDRFSIAGARVALKRLRQDSKKSSAMQGATSKMAEIRNSMEDLLLDISRMKNLFS